MVERCGALAGGGAISAMMTVLTETDDVDDPIAEMAKSLLDGHIVLSRTLAERGQFPAVDVPRSISRQATGLVAPAQREQAARVLAWLSAYDSARTLIETGLYVRGASPDIDVAIDRHPDIVRFLRQDRTVSHCTAQIRAELDRLAGRRG